MFFTLVAESLLVRRAYYYAHPVQMGGVRVWSVVK
jgi:hypothetical protein